MWFARVPYPRLLVAMRTKAASQPKGSNLRQLVALMPLLLMFGGLLAGYSFIFLLKWYNGVLLFRMDTMHSVCVIVYCIAVLASFAASVWWIGGLQALRPPGYDPKNPNPDPDEWRWKS